MNDPILAWGGVYAIRFRSGELYVGSSRWIGWRLKQHHEHLDRGRHDNGPMQSLFNRHGPPGMEYAVLETTAAEREREAVWCERLKPTLNIAPLHLPKGFRDDPEWEPPIFRPFFSDLGEHPVCRLVIWMPEDEARAFAMRCRVGRKKVSMNSAARELIRLAVSGQIQIDRTRAKKLSRTAAK